MVMDVTNHDGVINYTTNWRLAGGALTDSISFESSFSTTTANHESDGGTIPAAADHAAKSPLLLLLPPTPNNGEPFEITITFAQEHELRQIYIRSTARVYEVYYTKKGRDDKEYLCTVRCGVAMREDEEVLQISPLTESAASKSRVELVKDDDLMERKVKDNGNGRSNEDDWVEVKSDDTSLMNNEKDLLSMPQLGQQDFFEATAEIDDAEPCISITLRLLSLQDKRCALVDEVYVFADPVDPSEPEKQEASGTGNSSSSALMAMFMPTLLQLSRGKDLRKERDRQVSDNSNSTNPGSLGNSNDSDKIVNEVQQEPDFSKPDHGHAGVSSPVLVDTFAKQVGAATRVSEAEIKPAVACSNLETILHQLVNKVSRIETILTRFEDQMMKPINSIDARLQLVEKKLEHLGKKSLESELLVETKIPSPDSLGSNTDKPPETDELDGLTKNRENPQLSSCTETVVLDSCSIQNSEDYDVVLPKNRLDRSCTKFVEPGTEDNSISGNEIISAESEIRVGHSVGKESFEDSPKRSLSINDALASALAGLLSSTSITDKKYSQALVVTAPEFSNEDDVEREEKPPSGTCEDKSQVAADELGNIYSASESPTSSQKEPGITLHVEDNSQETINGVSENLGDSVGGYADAETMVRVRNDDLDEETVSLSTKADCYTERENLGYESETADSLVHEVEIPNVTTDCGSSRNFASKESEEEPKMDDVLKSVLDFQPTTSSVDFLTSVLDVKFNSEKKVSDSNCLFEALFMEESKTVVVDWDNEAFGDDNLVSVEDEQLKGPPTDTLSSLEMDHSEANEMQQLKLNTEIPTASLI